MWIDLGGNAYAWRHCGLTEPFGGVRGNHGSSRRHIWIEKGNNVGVRGAADASPLRLCAPLSREREISGTPRSPAGILVREQKSPRKVTAVCTPWISPSQFTKLWEREKTASSYPFFFLRRVLFSVLCFGILTGCCGDDSESSWTTTALKYKPE